MHDTPLTSQYGKCDKHHKDIAYAHAITKLATNSVSNYQYGRPIPDEMLQSLEQGNGMFLVEGCVPSDKTIQLKIRRTSDNSIAHTIDLPTRISKVEDFFRYKFFMPNHPAITSSDIPDEPQNWPDVERNDKHFVFAHGYNVNPTQSKAWAAELFKRMYQSGSNAKFTAFAWYGYQSQIPGTGISPNYQVNLKHAFYTGKTLKEFLDLLQGTKTVAAHSMGNVLVGAAMHDWNARPANYILLNSAAAKECYDPAEVNDASQEELMLQPWWRGYMKQVRASEWHARPWPDGDERSKLTWRGRLSKVINNGGQTQVYNFFSTGEEVLNNPAVNDPNLASSNPMQNGVFPWPKANKTLAMQEKRKGWGMTGNVHSSNYGGWYPNLSPYNPYLHVLTNDNPLEWRMRYPTEIPNTPLAVGWEHFVVRLMEKPFFNTGKIPQLFDWEKGSNTVGSNFAKNNHSILIAEMIPCTTLAAGRNAFNNALSDDPNTPEVDENKNYDLHSQFMTSASEWPFRTNKHDTGENLTRAWCHSDIREVAYLHTWQAFAKIIEIGNLNKTTTP